MARIATGPVVDKILDPAVLGRDRSLIAVRMADNAAEHGIVRGVGVAIGASGPFAGVVAAVNGEVGRVMCREGGSGPIDEAMAGTAGGWKARRGVDGLGGVVVVGLVARHASAGSVGVTAAAHMA